MIGYLADATGALCPTLVIDARSLPAEQSALLDVFGLTRCWLPVSAHSHVRKEQVNSEY
jgi:hypothetical protein